ncbi:MAG: Tyrosine-protein kinase EpsD [Myxococcaceae bacterium]|nr:Tyrosine-protein kinase EpsD [Myxococcaceae bacterium]
MTMTRSTRSLGDNLLLGAGHRAGVRWWRLLLTVALCTGAGAAWAFRHPPTYRAECVVEYAQDPSGVARGDALGGVLASDEWYNTQDFLLRGHSVADAVARRLKLHEDRGFFGVRARERFKRQVGDAAARISEELEVARVPRTRLVKVSIVDSDGQRAATIANSVAEVYLQQSLESRLESQRRAMAWLSEQIEQGSQRLAHSESELSRFLEQADAPSLPVAQQQELLTNEIKSLSQILTDARVRRIEQAARVAKLRAAQSENPFEIHTVEVDDNAQVKQLASDYQSTFLKFRELSAQGASGPAVDAEQSRLQTLTERLRVAIAGVVKSAQAELSAAQSVENQVLASLDAAQKQAQELQRHQLAYGRIERERQESATLLATLRERSNAIGIASASGAANARIVERAVPPSKPELPNWPQAAGIGLLVGLAVAAISKRLGRLLAPLRRSVKP